MNKEINDNKTNMVIGDCRLCLSINVKCIKTNGGSLLCKKKCATIENLLIIR